MNRKSWYRKKYDREVIQSRFVAPGPFPYVLVLDHLKAGWNVGKILRSANALGCREVHLVNVGPFDPSPAKGALRHTRTRLFTSLPESLASLLSEGYSLYSLDPEGRGRLYETPLPAKSAFIFGHEEFGLSFTADERPEVTGLRIEQFGRVQSLNVSVAASIVAYEYLRQRNFANEVSNGPSDS